MNLLSGCNSPEWLKSLHRKNRFFHITFFYSQNKYVYPSWEDLWVLAVLAYRSLCKRINIWYLNYSTLSQTLLLLPTDCIFKDPNFVFTFNCKRKTKAGVPQWPRFSPWSGNWDPTSYTVWPKTKPNQKIKREKEEKQRQGQWKWHTYQNFVHLYKLSKSDTSKMQKAAFVGHFLKIQNNLLCSCSITPTKLLEYLGHAAKWKRHTSEL